MIEAILNWAAMHAAEMLAALFVTGMISAMAWLDAAVKDAGRDAPFWLRVLSKFVSRVGGNVGFAKNNPVAQLKKLSVLAFVLLMPLALGCASVHKEGVRAGGMAEAYRLAGPAITVDAEGIAACVTDDPAEQPCTIEYAGSSELWAPIVEVMAVPFEALLQFFGRTLVPAGG